MYRWPPEWAGSDQTRENPPHILTQPISPQPIRPNAEWAVQSQSSSSLIMAPVVTIANNNSQNDFGDIEVINSLFTDGMEAENMRSNTAENLCHHTCHLHRHTVACGRSPPMCYPLLNTFLPRTYLNGLTSEHYSNNPILSMSMDVGNRSNGNMAVRSPPVSNTINKDKKIIPSPISGNGSQSGLNTTNEMDNTDNFGTNKISSDETKLNQSVGNRENTNKWKEKQASILKPGPAIKKSSNKKSANSSASRNSKLNGVQILEIAQKLGQIPGLESIRWESLLDSSRKQDVSDKEISTRVQEAEILGSRLFGGDLEKLLSSLLSQHLDFLVYFVRMSLSGDTNELKEVREMLWRTLTAVRDREEAEGEHSD